MCTANKEMNVDAIFAVTNTTQAVVKIRSLYWSLPKLHSHRGLLSALNHWTR